MMRLPVRRILAIAVLAGTLLIDAQLMIGEECTNDSECDSGLCFRGFQLPEDPGTCRCNATDNAGCDDGHVCTNVELAFDGEPLCTVCGDPNKDSCLENWQYCRDLELGGCANILVMESCPLQFACEGEPSLGLGEDCTGDFQCQSGTCMSAALMGQGRTCICNLDTNAGCSAVEECVFTTSSQPYCALPIGAVCIEAESEKCVSDFCFSGSCQCHPVLNTGCPETQECVGDDSTGYACAAAASSLLPIGASCGFDNYVCETERCFWTFDNYDGVCSCNTETDAGCPSNTNCVIDVIGDGAPYCGLPDGAACTAEGQADCSEDTCCQSGICGSSGTCEAAPIVSLGSKCRENSDCDTGYCYFGLMPPDTAGYCACNPGFSDGCPDGRTCTISNVIADVPPFCGLPPGSACDETAIFDCEFENCFQGTCQCAVEPFNRGCTEPATCVGDETVGYQCTNFNGQIETTPSTSPTAASTPSQTVASTLSPTNAPTPSPTNAPTLSPTNAPTPSPTNTSTPSPSSAPTSNMTIGGGQTADPTAARTSNMSIGGGTSPSPSPTTDSETKVITSDPSSSPPSGPLRNPTVGPTEDPEFLVTQGPTSFSASPRRKTTSILIISLLVLLSQHLH